MWLNVRFCRTVHTNPPGTKNKKMPHVRICRIMAQIERSDTQLTTSCPHADVRVGKTQWTVVQTSIFKKMKHDAINDAENDDASDGKDNHMKI